MTNSVDGTINGAVVARASRRARAMRADARNNREKIVVAARDLFSEHAAVVSMDEIARRAGLGAGTLARNFPSRNELIDAVYQHELAGLSELAVRLEKDPDSWGALREWLHRYLEFSQLAKTMVGGLDRIAARPLDVEGLSEEIERALGNVLIRAQADRVVRAGLTARDLVQLVGGLVFSIGALESRNDFHFDLLMSGIRAD